jgi:hypothetical protein
MKKSNTIKLIFSVVLLAGATFIAVGYFRRDDGIAEKTFYYDLSEKKLFAGPREALPPIRGLNNAEEDGVRAVVIAANGNSKDEAGRKIVYLEKYAPELKKQIEAVRTGAEKPLPTKVRNSYRFVKRVEEPEWHTLNSPEAEKILTDWNVPGPDGKFPTIAVP